MEEVENKIKNKEIDKIKEEKDVLFKVKVIRARYKNLHIINPHTGEKIRVRMAGEMLHERIGKLCRRRRGVNF